MSNFAKYESTWMGHCYAERVSVAPYLAVDRGKSSALALPFGRGSVGGLACCVVDYRRVGDGWFRESRGERSSFGVHATASFSSELFLDDIWWR